MGNPWSSVAKALNEGRLVRPGACSECGQSERRIIAHHDSYASEHAQTIRWLCDRCHRAFHAEHPEQANAQNLTVQLKIPSDMMKGIKMADRRERRGKANMIRELIWRGLYSSVAGDPK